MEFPTTSRFALVAALFAAAALPLHAHHGAAAYDLTTPTTLAATVAELDWRNPHALIQFTVAAGDGSVETWTAETAGLVILNRAGWTRHSLNRGDRITIVGFRARNGSTTMILQRVVLADGRELNNFVPR
jgi:hypothetical protein